jgi:hypothetical protein
MSSDLSNPIIKKARIKSSPIVSKPRTASKPRTVSKPQTVSKFSQDFFISASLKFEEWLSKKTFHNFNTNQNPSRLYLDRESHVSSSVAFNNAFNKINTFEEYQNNEAKYLGAMILPGNSLLIYKLARMYFIQARYEPNPEDNHRYMYYSFEYHRIFFNIQAMETVGGILYEGLVDVLIDSLDNIISYYIMCIMSETTNHYITFSINTPSNIKVLTYYAYMRWYFGRSKNDNPHVSSILKPLNEIGNIITNLTYKKMVTITKKPPESPKEIFMNVIEALTFIFESKTYLKTSVTLV